MPDICDRLIAGLFATVDDAKAAAQADFDRRVSSALEPAAQDGAEVKRLRAIAEGMERAAKIAAAFAEENLRMANDSIILDPALSARRKGAKPSAADFADSEKFQLDGTIHSSMYHAATNIAEAIRAAALRAHEQGGA